MGENHKRVVQEMLKARMPGGDSDQRMKPVAAQRLATS